MPVRPTMSQIISRVRLMIADPAGASQQFQDQDIQDTCDEHVDFVRYEPLLIAPTIVNTASTGNQAATIFINYFSRYRWWESDVVVEGYNNGQAWVVLTPSSTDYVNGHFWFETPSTEFTTPTVPGQLPPVFATGKVYDLNWTAADLLELWASTLVRSYDLAIDGQNLKLSQQAAMMNKQAELFRRKAKPVAAPMTRRDVLPVMGARRMRLLDNDELLKG